MPIPIPILVGAGAALAAAAGWVYRHLSQPHPPRDEHRPEQASAKDWRPLMDAFETHVRSPLKAWPTVATRWRSCGDFPLEYAQRGEILAESGQLTGLSYTLVFACMHFDALCGLMMEQKFRDPLSAALSRPAAADGNGPAVLHVDFGCGPGTAAWAVMNVLPHDTRVTTMGYDHNPHLVELARAMTADVVRDSGRGSTCRRFHDDKEAFEQDVESALAEYQWHAVLVTVNSVFGKMQPIDDVVLVERWIGRLCENARPATVFVAGTHPQFEVPRVGGVFQRIAEGVPGARMLYDQLLPVRSGSPRRYDAPSWVVFEPQPQLAHIVRVAADAG